MIGPRQTTYAPPLRVLLGACLLAASLAAEESDYRIEYLDVGGPENATLGGNVTLICKASPSNSLVWWKLNGRNVSSEGSDREQVNRTVTDSVVVLTLWVRRVTIQHAGNYSCHAVLPENREIQDEKTFELSVVLEGKVVMKKNARVDHGKKGVLECAMSGYPLEDVGWQIENAGLRELIRENMATTLVNTTYAVTTLNFDNVDSRDNGTYACAARGPQGQFKEFVHLFVLDKPKVKIDVVKAVGSHVLYVNWTVNDGNSPIQKFFLKTKKAGTLEWVHYPELIGSGNTSFLIKSLLNNTGYDVALMTINAKGTADSRYNQTVTTLSSDPSFVPEVEVKGTTSNSIYLVWGRPPPEVRDYIQYYQIILHNNLTRQETIHPASSMDAYMFSSLTPFTTYHVKIAACSEYTKQCGNWSKEVSGVTLDGISDPPEKVSVVCRFDNISHASFVSISWQPPKNPNGMIDHYTVVLTGVASYRNHKGLLENVTYGPRDKSVPATSTTARFEVIPPNTNYTVNVSVATRSRQSSKGTLSQCSMSPTVPSKDKLLRFNWEKVEWENGRWLFRLNLDRVTERNGPICCYMVYIVKLKPGQRATDLPQPEELHVSTYEEVHKDTTGGAYIAEALDSAAWNSEILLGDGKSVNFKESPCQYCLSLHHRRRVEKQKATTTPPPLAHIPGLYLPTSELPESTEADMDLDLEVSTVGVPEPLRLGVSNYLSRDIPERFRRLSREAESTSLRPPVADTLAYDGVLDNKFNYTGFLEILVYGDNGTMIPAYSNYFMSLALRPTEAEVPDESIELTIALYVLIVLVVIVFVLLVVLFVLHNYTKTVAEEQGIEMTFTNTLMHLCRHVGGRHVPVSSSPPDLPPLSKADLICAVAERHRDSDYGFQHEFEMLPDRFPDRTTRASEARENFYKNRYPDIKAYDQTRVRLSQTDGIAGSDYINANYVVGYKERKKFICAQGPMDNTVNEFWRMVWEQHLEMILMLTNLEEYSKTKCAKYWPDKDAGEKKFGDFSVTHVQEKRFSDYIIRELKLRQCYEGSCEKDKDEERTIVQYHYLVWKDFMAPDNPSGILKFIKRINEDYSLEKGPILIHCSAGVGRTGTLVALDSLLQQLREENQVAIFNTVCDLRHQRNFLVQSLKQYIFVYRALLEVSQSGDTEIKVVNLKSHVEKLRHKENGKDKSPLELEFEKLEVLVDDKAKSWNLGGSVEENKAKNRNENVIPYDRNRVMLAPIPGKDHSTYINASFIEGYDHSESFIMAQDPMPNTISDFWRMICEQCVATLVMMSDLGDGPRKCVRYWPEPDDESTYENMRVKYIQSESCPYYTRREFAVTNIKTDDTIITTQFQYNGWPTVEGEVPEVTRGLLELVAQTQESPGPTVVHCNYGSERSSIFIALSILVQQLKTERAVDVFTVARKLRSQRPMMLHNFADYELLHRAIVNYADLHHMTENGTTSPL